MAQAQLLRALGALPLAMAAIVGGLMTGLSEPLAAQRSDELDLARIRARAAAQAAEAEAFSKAIARRGAALRQEATATSEAALANVRTASAAAAKSPSAAFDFDAMVRTAQAEANPDAGPRLIAFASLSMPGHALRQMIDDVGAAGGAIVFRGLPSNSAATFTSALAKVLPQGSVRASVGIDPRLFRAFAVETVPTYVVTATTVELCDGLDCRSTPPPHDQLRGNVTLGHALETFAEGCGPGAQAATVFRRRLEASR